MADGILTPCNVARSWDWFRQVSAPCHAAYGSGIITVNSPSECDVMQCDIWLRDNMPLNSPKHPPYWNSTSGFDFDHITAVGMSCCTYLRNFIQIGPPSAEKNKNLGIANRSHVSCAHNTSRAPITPWPWDRPTEVAKWNAAYVDEMSFFHRTSYCPN